MGGRSKGLGNASSCLEDEWSVFNNIAGIAATKNTIASFAYDAQPGFPPFNKMASAFSLPIKWGIAGSGIFRFGDELYNEQLITLGFANAFGNTSLGLKLNYIQYNATGFGTKGLWSISFGGLSRITTNFLMGAHIVNINQPNISKPEQEKLPTTVILGFAVHLTSQTLIAAELEKDISAPLKYKAGIEYKPIKKFAFRTGFNLNPGALFFGLGFRPRKFSLDYAFQHNLDIGSRHQACVGYIFGRQK